LDLNKTYGKLDISAGAGPSGLKNHALKVMANRSFDDEEADGAMAESVLFYTGLVNGDLPLWFRNAIETGKGFAIWKEIGKDVRPCTPVDVLARAAEQAVAAQTKKAPCNERAQGERAITIL